MLSKSDTELLTRVGPGTSMGELVRRYRIPVSLLSEVGAVMAALPENVEWREYMVPHHVSYRMAS